MTRRIAAWALASGLLAGAAWAQAPLVAPAQWGAEDQAGASNTQTPEKARQAASLITDGNTYPLARPLNGDTPLFGQRVLAIRGTGAPASPPFGSNAAIYNDDFVAGEINQIGTQFDALGHFGQMGPDGPLYYGGRTGAEVNAPNGLAALGVEHVKPFFTRGLLVDMERQNGGPLQPGDEVTIEEMEQALRDQGIDPDSIGSGDVVLIHTGWGRLFGVDNARFLSGSPGVGLDGAVWLADKGVALIGADVNAVEVSPGDPAHGAAPVHQEMLMRRGVYLMENVATERLADAGVYEFAFSFTPIPLEGATGAPANALAIR